jgi:hypothetical protein
MQESNQGEVDGDDNTRILLKRIPICTKSINA